MSEPEPRRSVRATKGQHTKAFDDQPIEPPKKRGRKKKQEEEPEDEIIRCVCGATEQDGDSEEPWIACDKCGAWQHNVCMGMSVFSEDLPKNYYCEQCAPQDHKELLSAMAKGELPWEARRKAYEDEQAEKKKKKKKGGRVGKRASDPREDLSQDARSSKAEDSPAPSETNQKKDKKDSGAKATTGKRKVRDEEKETKIPAPKIRKVAEPEAPIVEYTAPADLTAKVADLPDDRKGSAQLLQKALSAILTAAVKDKSVTLPKDTTVAAKAERLALEIERAVHDTHPDRSHYAAQARALYANMKINADLTKRLVKRTLSPPMLATMTADELATKERQDANAQLKAISEKQSILITDEGPRVRRTHKGEEIVENDSFQQSDEARSFIRRPSGREGGADKTDGEQRYDNSVELPAHGGLQIDTQGARQSPKHPDFDINKVFAKTPTGSHTRRPSAPLHGPGVDPDVDRLLQDETDSPPYSPTDETDPDVVWRGHLVMSSIADFPAAAKYVAGANLSRAINLPWTSLIPKKLTVAGRIDEQKAIEYLCGLRYADLTDIVVVALSPASDTFRQEFQTLFEYFVNKKRYAVIGDKGLGNVRDTYLVPVPAGEGNVPEFLLNLADNFVPQKRTEPMLLGVFVYRNPSRPSQPPVGATQSPVTNSPTPTQGGFPRHPSISGPAFSPTVPQGPFQHPGQPPAGHNAHGPQQHPTQGAHQAVPPGQPPAGYTADRGPEANQERRQREGQALAHEVLGPLVNSRTVPFLMPHAHAMTRTEWEVIKGIYERDPKAREDLQHLSQLLEKQPPVAGKTGGVPAAGPQGVAPPA